MPSTDTSDAVRVRLHRSLYTRQAIDEAAAAFADFATFAIGADGEHYVVDITGINRNVQGDVVAEFCNFAFANTARRQRSAHA